MFQGGYLRYATIHHDLDESNNAGVHNIKNGNGVELLHMDL